MHGGGAPQVKQAAAERLAALVDPAITTLHELLAASREDVRLGAAKDVLDRNGFKPKDKIEAKTEMKVIVEYADAHPDASATP